MPLVPPQGYLKIENIHRQGLAADRPAAANVVPGTLYFSTDTLVLERSDGSTWSSYSGTGSADSVGVMGPPGLDGIDAEEPLIIPGPIGLTGGIGATGATGPQGPPGLDAYSEEKDELWAPPSIIKFPSDGTWVEYTPVWSCASGAAPAKGNGSLVGKAMRMNKTVFAYISFIAGSTTTFGSGGTFLFTLPSAFSLASGAHGFLDVRVLDAGTRWYFSKGFLSGTDQVMFTDDDTGIAYSDAYPMTWAQFDQILALVMYEEG